MPAGVLLEEGRCAARRRTQLIPPLSQYFSAHLLLQLCLIYSKPSSSSSSPLSLILLISPLPAPVPPLL